MIVSVKSLDAAGEHWKRGSGITGKAVIVCCFGKLVVYGPQIVVSDKVYVTKLVSGSIDCHGRYKTIWFIIVDENTFAMTSIKNNMVIADVIFFEKPKGMGFFIIVSCCEENDHILWGDIFQKFFSTR